MLQMQLECIMKKMRILTKWMVNSYLIIQAFLVFCIFLCAVTLITHQTCYLNPKPKWKLSSTERLRCFHILKFIRPQISRACLSARNHLLPEYLCFFPSFFVSKQLYRQSLRTHTVRDTGFHLLFSSISHASTQE